MNFYFAYKRLTEIRIVCDELCALICIYVVKFLTCKSLFRFSIHIFCIEFHFSEIGKYRQGYRRWFTTISLTYTHIIIHPYNAYSYDCTLQRTSNSIMLTDIFQYYTTLHRKTSKMVTFNLMDLNSISNLCFIHLYNITFNKM